MDIKKYINQKKIYVDKYLDKILPPISQKPHKLYRAMRYSVFTGGKRLRPILAIASCETFGGNIRKVIPAACAIEFIHTYSLIHDDLPCMDNDNYRRGRFSCHKKFGEAIALLAGNALLVLGFNLLTDKLNNKYALRVMNILTQAVGFEGLITGQAEEITQTKTKLKNFNEYIYKHKTASLIRASLMVGAIIADASGKNLQKISEFGEKFGIAYQLIDDILDKDGYFKKYGYYKTLTRTKNIVNKSKNILSSISYDSSILSGFVDYVLGRVNDYE